MTGLSAGLVPPGTRGRRRAGFLLAAFGSVGLVLVTAGLAFALGLLDGDDGPLGLEGQRRQIVAFLDAADTAIVSAEQAADDADGSLGATATAADSTATMMSDLSLTMAELAGSLRIDIFGSRPFAAAADDMDRVAAQSATVAADLEEAAGAVRLAAEDMAQLSVDLAAVRSDIDAIRARMAGPIDAGPWRLLLVATLLWIAIPAGASLWLGVRWLSSRVPVGREAASVATPPTSGRGSAPTLRPRGERRD